MSQYKEKNDNEYHIASKSESGFIKKRTFNDTRQLVFCHSSKVTTMAN